MISAVDAQPEETPAEEVAEDPNVEADVTEVVEDAAKEIEAETKEADEPETDAKA